MKKKPIPMFIIEEHHEAFIVWNYAIQQGLIPPTGNTLFHVDEHSDMGTPQLNTSIHELNGNINAIRNFTYKELNIASFIMPAVYKGIFTQVYWIKQKYKKENGHFEKMYVRSCNQKGEKLLSGKLNDLEKKGDDVDRKEFDYCLKNIYHLPSNVNVVLDIDLGCFSCTGNPNEIEEIIIEITEIEYNKFNCIPYHRLRSSGLNRIETITENNKYFYKLNAFDSIYPSSLLVDLDIINNQIINSRQQVEIKNITSTIIDICRSRHSGYPHSEQVKDIESALIEELSIMLQLQIIRLKNI